MQFSGQVLLIGIIKHSKRIHERSQFLREDYEITCKNEKNHNITTDHLATPVVVRYAGYGWFETVGVVALVAGIVHKHALVVTRKPGKSRVILYDRDNVTWLVETRQWKANMY